MTSKNGLSLATVGYSLIIQGVLLIFLAPFVLFLFLIKRALAESNKKFYNKVFISQIVVYLLFYSFVYYKVYLSSTTRSKINVSTRITERKVWDKLRSEFKNNDTFRKYKSDSIINHMYDVVDPAYKVFKKYMIAVAAKEGYELVADFDNLITADQMSIRPLDTIYNKKGYTNLIIFRYQWKGSNLQLEAQVLCDENSNCVLIKEGIKGKE